MLPYQWGHWVVSLGKTVPESEGLGFDRSLAFRKPFDPAQVTTPFLPVRMWDFHLSEGWVELEDF